jgi:AraC-like DNA-binding protein
VEQKNLSYFKNRFTIPQPMHIEKHTMIDPVVIDLEINPTRPVISFAASIYNNKCTGPHAHPRGQIMYAREGVMKVITQQQVWMVTPMQAIWVPAMEMHEVCFLNHVEVRDLFLDPSITTHLPATSFAFDVTSFFKELMARITKIDWNQPLTDSEYRIVQVLLDEISVLPPATLKLPVGKDEKIHTVTDYLIRFMTDMSLEDAAALARISPRTLSRSFVNETGMTYPDWCTKLKLLEAISRLQAGETIAQVAVDLGYESTSAFTFMFRKSMGKPPCVYLRENNGL